MAELAFGDRSLCDMGPALLEIAGAFDNNGLATTTKTITTTTTTIKRYKTKWEENPQIAVEPSEPIIWNS